MLVAGTTFFMLADSAKQVGLVRCSGFYLLKLCLIAIFSKLEYVGAYLYILFFSSGKIFFFYLAIAILYITMLAINKWQLPYK